MIIEENMNKRLLSFLLLLTIFTSLLFTGCTPKLYKSRNFSIFDTYSELIGYETSAKKFDKISNKIFSALSEYHKLFDIYNEYEGIPNLCTVNKLVDGEHPVVKVDRRIIDMLLYAKEMHELTGGKMNIAMGSVLSIWHDYRTKGIDEPWNAELPPMDLLQAAAEHTNIDNLIIDEENSTVWLRDPQMKLDVGAFAKGYAVEMAARMLEDEGKSGYSISVGGNIRTVGYTANGNKWAAGIENPTLDDENPYIAYISLAGEAIVTSGSYQRYYVVIDSAECSSCEWVYDTEKGIPDQNINPGTQPSKLATDIKCPACESKIYKISNRYHHIIDPDTLMPAQRGFLSVSIICNDSGMGDGLSTALFCMDLEDGMALINSLEGVEAMWVAKDETKYYSDGFDRFFTE